MGRGDRNTVAVSFAVLLGVALLAGAIGGTVETIVVIAVLAGLAILVFLYPLGW